MFYNFRAQALSHRKWQQEPRIDVNHQGEKKLVVRIPTVLVRSQTYELFIGRGENLGWVGLKWCSQKPRRGGGTITMRNNKSFTRLLSHNSTVNNDTTLGVDYRVTSDVLFIHLPRGAREVNDWFHHLPDVSDNPQDTRRKMATMHGVPSSD